MQTTVRRGDIFYVGGGTATGSEQRANRPAVVVSNDAGNRYASIVEMVYLTTREKASLPTHVRINSAERTSLALCEQIVTVCKSRLERRIGSVTAEEMQNIDKALKRSLGIHIMGGDSMQITMVTPFGEMKFVMSPDKVTTLMQQAVQSASGQEPGAQEKPQPPAPEASPQAQEPPEAPQTATGRPHSRVERMFGNFKAGTQPGQREGDEPPEAAQQAGPSTYKGFLLIKCEHCGEVKGFCAKIPASRNACSKCGKVTELRGLKPLHLKCKCGSEFTYRTNMTDEAFDWPCLNCGSLVDLELNRRGDTYVTVGD